MKLPSNIILNFSLYTSTINNVIISINLNEIYLNIRKS